MYHGFSTESVSHKRSIIALCNVPQPERKQPSNRHRCGYDCIASFIWTLTLSDTTAKFVKEFCRKSKVDAIKPHYLNTGEPVILSDGTLVKMDGVNNYQLNIMADSETRKLTNPSHNILYCSCAERIQREKAGLEGDCEDENND